MKSSREKILKNIKKNIKKRVPLKVVEFDPIRFEDPLEIFLQNFKLAGGEVVEEIKDDIIILDGIFGVAENGAVLLKEIEDTKKYTFFEEIAIILDKKNILNNMQEAYEKLNINSFALFLAGPSKTADIEQSLVIGAHGAKRVYLKLI